MDIKKLINKFIFAIIVHKIYIFIKAESSIKIKTIFSFYKTSNTFRLFRKRANYWPSCTRLSFKSVLEEMTQISWTCLTAQVEPTALFLRLLRKLAAIFPFFKSDIRSNQSGKIWGRCNILIEKGYFEFFTWWY